MRERALRAWVPLLVLALLAPFAAGSHGDSEDPLEEDERDLRPDLAVVRQYVSPEEPHDEAPFDLCALFRNYGHDDPGSFNVALQLGDRRVAFERFHQIPENGAVVCAENLTAPQGYHRFQAFADVDDEVDERSEDGNERTMKFLVREKPLPDLDVDLRLRPDPPREGESLTLIATVRNIGETVARNFTVDFRMDGERVGRENVTGVAAGGRASAYMTLAPWDVPEGERVFGVVVDPVGKVNETNRENNEATQVVDVPRTPRPDVNVTDAVYARNVTVGDVVRFTAVVSNDGDEDAGRVRVTLRLGDGTLLDTTTLPDLAPGTWEAVTTRWAPDTPGNHTVNVTAEPLSRVREDSAENNRRHFTVVARGQDEAAPLPDLRVERIVSSAHRPGPGEPVNFTAVLRNAGHATASPFNVTFTADGNALETVRVGTVPADAYATVTTTWHGPPGMHEITVAVDPDGEIEELDEGRNVLTLPFQVAPQTPEEPEDDDDKAPPPGDTEPDTPSAGATAVLDVTSVELVTPTDEEDVVKPRIVARVTNRGDVVAPPFQVIFHVDGARVGAEEMQGLAPGREATVSQDLTDAIVAASDGDRRHVARVVAVFQGEREPGAFAQRESPFTIAAEDAAVPAPGAVLLAAGVAAAAALVRRTRR